MVKPYGKKWGVFHCTGGDKYSLIKGMVFDTRVQALRAHAAIILSKKRRGKL